MRRRPLQPPRRHAHPPRTAAAAVALLLLALFRPAASAAAAPTPPRPPPFPAYPFCSLARHLIHPQSYVPAPAASAQPVASADAVAEAASRFFYDGEYFLTEQRDVATALRYFRLAALLGQPAAHTSAAAILLVGSRAVPRDIPAAVRHVASAARRGHPDAHALLGSLHRTGLADRHGVPRSHARAVLFDTMAARAGSMTAATALGFRYLHGVAVPRSCPRAGRFYARAARAVATNSRHWPTALNFVEAKPPLPSLLHETQSQRLDEHALARKHATGNAGPADAEDTDIVQFFQHSAERGSAEHRTALGALHIYGGHGIEPDEQVARQHLRRAANANDGDAHGILGHLDMRARRNESAVLSLRKSAAYNSPIGHYALGMAYRHALLGMPRDLSRAAMHFNLTLERESTHAGALYELGWLYWHGRGVDRDEVHAFNLFERAAKEGQLQSRLHVGTMLFEGNAPGRAPKKGDCARAVRLLKSVAEDGDWRKLLDLAADEVADGDWYGALHRYLLAAHAGIELAQYNAAFLLEHAHQLPHDKDRLPELAHWRRDRRLQLAHMLYELSARQGHTDALIRSANVQYIELGNLRAAARTFRLAAKLNNAEGMVALGIMHARGLGVAHDRARAVRMFERARSADEEAVAPALVALVGFHVAWFFEDAWAVVRRHVDPLLSAADGDAAKLQSGAPLFGTEDFIVLGGLAVALVTVLVLRSKRLARQTHLDVEPGR